MSVTQQQLTNHILNLKKNNKCVLLKNLDTEDSACKSGTISL